MVYMGNKTKYFEKKHIKKNKLNLVRKNIKMFKKIRGNFLFMLNIYLVGWSLMEVEIYNE